MLQQTGIEPISIGWPILFGILCPICIACSSFSLKHGAIKRGMEPTHIIYNGQLVINSIFLIAGLIYWS